MAEVVVNGRRIAIDSNHRGVTVTGPGTSVVVTTGAPRSLCQRPVRGINLAGAEFGTDPRTHPQFSNKTPGVVGRDYFYNSRETVEFFASIGINRFRIPIRWERIQPTPGAELDAAELNRLQVFLGSFASVGATAIIDLHNYGGYVFDRAGQGQEQKIDDATGLLTGAHFADIWARLSGVFRTDPTVEAYGLMNEPNGMGAGVWKNASQLAVSAIRRNSDHKLTLISGDAWSHSCDWLIANGPRPWIVDPADNVVYEAHCYFDRDHSGTYQGTFAAESANALPDDLHFRGAMRLVPFAQWCRTNQVRGWIGEYGVPNDPGWGDTLDQFHDALDFFGLSSCYWAAGEFWGPYNLSVQPADLKNPEIRPQLGRLIRRR